MSCLLSRVTLVLLGALTIGTPAYAQSARAAGVDFTFGSHATNGGIVRERSGVFVDALAVGRLYGAKRWALVAGAGASAAFVGSVLGASADECVPLPSGCAPRGNFRAMNLLAGAAYRVGSNTIRAQFGPSFNRGANDKSVGLQGRIDTSAPLSGNLGVGAMLRATALPSHGGQRLTLWAFGVGLAFR